MYLIPEIYCTPKEATSSQASTWPPLAGRDCVFSSTTTALLLLTALILTSRFCLRLQKRYLEEVKLVDCIVFPVQVLQRLADMPEVFVSVITGRCLPDIKAKVSTGCLDLCEGMWTSSQFDALQLSR